MELITRNNLQSNSAYVPLSRPPRGRLKPKWMTERALTKLNHKKEAFTLYKATRDASDYTKYTKARNQAKWECRKAIRNHEKSIAQASKESPKAFFNFAKSKLKTVVGVADLSKPDGSVASLDIDKENTLNDSFSDVFTREDIVLCPV